MMFHVKQFFASLMAVLLIAGQGFAALPNQLKSARMSDSTLASTIDNEVGNLETAIADILGVPINTNVSAAMFVVTAAGLTNVVFQDLAGSPTSAGRLARNAAVLQFHDGTAARTLAMLATNQTFTGQMTFSEATAPIIAAKLGPSSTQQHTLPAVTSDTIVLLGATQTLTGKTLTSPTITGASLTTATLTSPAINGTVTTSGLTLPAFAAGGTISGATGITSIGTIATGVWQGTAVGGQWGGTGANLSACAQGGLPYFTSTGVQACLAVGTSGQVPKSQGAAANLTWFTPIFTKSFASTQQTITAAGSLTIAHSLGATPILVQWELVCTSADLGYSTNDIYKGSFGRVGSDRDDGVGIVVDATNLNVRFGRDPEVLAIIDKTLGDQAAIDPTKWKIVFRAFL